MRLIQKLKGECKQIFLIKEEPKSIAKGFALGSFIGMLPIPGFQIMIAFVMASIFKFNRKSACIAVFNTNVATGLFVFAFNFWLGKKLLGLDTDFVMPNNLGFGFISTILESGIDVFISLTLGGCITGTLAAIISYRSVILILEKRAMKKALIDENAMSEDYVVVTGASLGLGKAIAEQFAKRGFNLILLSLPNENLEVLSNNLQNLYNIKVQFREVDLTNQSELDKAVNWINENFKIKALINNAGIGGSNHFQNVSSQYVDDILLLNIRVLVHLTHKLIKNLKNNSQSYILNVASMASFGPIPYKTVYPASKAFVYSFSRGLSAELKKDGVSVSVAHPGGMATNKNVSLRINQHSKLVKLTILSPEKTAEICVRQMLKNDSLIIPGLANKVSWLFFKICPVEIQLHLFERSIKKELHRSQAIQNAA